MLLVEVNISKIAFFIAAQNFSQVVTKFITCDDVTRFDGTFSKYWRSWWRLNFYLT